MGGKTETKGKTKGKTETKGGKTKGKTKTIKGGNGKAGSNGKATALNSRSPTPKGTFPTAKLKAQAAKIEREYLARKRVVAEKKEKKWNKKVLQVKVDKFADKVQVKKKAAVKKNM